MRHGVDKLFSCRGIQIAVQFWVRNDHKVICFLPEYLFDYQQVNQRKKQASLGLKTVKSSKLPDSVGTLNKMAAKGVMVKTPS